MKILNLETSKDGKNINFEMSKPSVVFQHVSTWSFCMKTKYLVILRQINYAYKLDLSTELHPRCGEAKNHIIMFTLLSFKLFPVMSSNA